MWPEMRSKTRGFISGIIMLLCVIFALGAGSARADVDVVARGLAVGAKQPATCNAQASQASILSCRSQLLATGGKIMLPAGTITLTSSLPVDSNIWYVGSQPNGAPQSVDPGDNWTAGSGQPGTLLQGDGTFAAFAGKTTALGTPDDGTTAVYNWGLENLTLSNFTYGVNVGATNSFGLFHSHIYNVWVTGATQWAMNIENMGFLDIQNIYARQSANCFRFAASLGTTYNPGNSHLKRSFCYARDNFMRGVVFEAYNNTIMGSWDTLQVQVNNFANSLVTQAATMSNGSTSILVTDGTQFRVGMPLSVASTANGFVQNQIYFVLSVSGNTLTVGDSRNSTARSATGSAAVNIVTYGFSSLELVALQTGGSSSLNGMNFLGLDLEGKSSCTIYIDNVNGVSLQGTAMNPTAFSHICARATNNGRADLAPGVMVMDFGGSSGTSFASYGTRGTPVQADGFGIWRDNTRVVNCLHLSARDSGGVCDIESHPLAGASFLATPNAALGQRVHQTTATSATVSAFDAGIEVYSGSVDGTLTLPVLTDASVSTSNMGLPFWFMNQTTHLLTVATSSSQTFNGVAGKTSVLVGPGQMAMVWGAKNSSGTLQWAAMISRDLLAASAAPALGAGCGTGATVVGSDGAGTITAGTGPGSCVVTFTVTRPLAPHCNVTDQAGAVPVYSESTTALTLTPTASHVYDYACAA